MQIEPVSAAVTALVIAVVYFLPAIGASGRKGAGTLFAVNLFLGWTVLGWLACFVWAFFLPKRGTGSKGELSTTGATDRRNRIAPGVKLAKNEDGTFTVLE